MDIDLPLTMVAHTVATTVTEMKAEIPPSMVAHLVTNQAVSEVDAATSAAPVEPSVVPVKETVIVPETAPVLTAVETSSAEKTKERPEWLSEACKDLIANSTLQAATAQNTPVQAPPVQTAQVETATKAPPSSNQQEVLPSMVAHTVTTQAIPDATTPNVESFPNNNIEPVTTMAEAAGLISMVAHFVELASGEPISEVVDAPKKEAAVEKAAASQAGTAQKLECQYSSLYQKCMYIKYI